MRFQFCLLALAFPISSAANALAATTYTVTDLGTLGGTSSYGTAINDLGHAVGYSTLPGGETRAFLWTPGGGMQNLGTLGSGESRALDINNNDNVVGATNDQFSNDVAFRWTLPLGMFLIDSPNIGVAADLNENNEAIGSRYGAAASSRVRVWSPSDVVSTPYPASNFRGVAINDGGQFVASFVGAGSGFYSTGSGPFVNLPGFLPTDIDNNRLISGSTGGIAALWDIDTSTITMLGKLSPTDTFSAALGISPNATVVGVSQGSGGFIADSTFSSIISLTSLLDSGYLGWSILTAEDINSAGQIIGVGEFNGVSHAVILSPVPEPTTLALATSALAALLVFHGRARQPGQTRDFAN